MPTPNGKRLTYKMTSPANLGKTAIKRLEKKAKSRGTSIPQEIAREDYEDMVNWRGLKNSKAGEKAAKSISNMQKKKTIEENSRIAIKTKGKSLNWSKGGKLSRKKC